MPLLSPTQTLFPGQERAFFQFRSHIYTVYSYIVVASSRCLFQLGSYGALISFRAASLLVKFLREDNRYRFLRRGKWSYRSEACPYTHTQGVLKLDENLYLQIMAFYHYMLHPSLPPPNNQSNRNIIIIIKSCCQVNLLKQDLYHVISVIAQYCG